MSGSMLNPKNVFSFVAGEDVLANRFVCLKGDGLLYVGNGGNGGDDKTPIGASMNGAKSGGTVDVATSGIAQVLAGQDLNAGDYAASDENGVAIDPGGVKNGIVVVGASEGGLASVLINV